MCAILQEHATFRCVTLQEHYYLKVCYITRTLLSLGVLPYKNTTILMCVTLQEHYYLKVCYLTRTLLS